MKLGCWASWSLLKSGQDLDAVPCSHVVKGGRPRILEQITETETKCAVVNIEDN